MGIASQSTAKVVSGETRSSGSKGVSRAGAKVHGVTPWLLLWLAVIELTCSFVKPLQYVDIPGQLLEDKDQLDCKLAALERGGPIDVLVLGSSLASATSQADDLVPTPSDPTPYRFHTAARHFDLCMQENGLKTTTFNLGIDACLINEDAALFERVVKSAHIPKLVLLLVAPRDFIDNQHPPDAHVVRRLAATKHWFGDLSWTNSPEKNFNALLEPVSSIYRQRSSYRQVVELSSVSALHRTPNLFYAQRSAQYWHLFQPPKLLVTFGGKPKQRRHLSREDAAAKMSEYYQRSYLPVNHKRLEIELNSLSTLLARLHQLGVTVRVINMPRSVENDNMLPAAFRQEYRERLGAICALQGEQVWDLQNDHEFGDLCFADGVHLDPNGAKKFNTMVASRLCSDQGVKRKLSGLRRANDIGLPIGDNR